MKFVEVRRDGSGFIEHRNSSLLCVCVAVLLSLMSSSSSSSLSVVIVLIVLYMYYTVCLFACAAPYIHISCVVGFSTPQDELWNVGWLAWAMD